MAAIPVEAEVALEEAAAATVAFPKPASMGVGAAVGLLEGAGLVVVQVGGETCSSRGSGRSSRRANAAGAAVVADLGVRARICRDRLQVVDRGRIILESAFNAFFFPNIRVRSLGLAVYMVLRFPLAMQFFLLAGGLICKVSAGLLGSRRSGCDS